MDPALEPLTVTHFRECPLHEDAVLTMECLNCSELVSSADGGCSYCGTTEEAWGGEWRGPAGCICDDIDEGLQADEAERRAGL